MKPRVPEYIREAQLSGRELDVPGTLLRLDPDLTGGYTHGVVIGVENGELVILPGNSRSEVLTADGERVGLYIDPAFIEEIGATYDGRVSQMPRVVSKDAQSEPPKALPYDPDQPGHYLYIERPLSEAPPGAAPVDEGSIPTVLYERTLPQGGDEINKLRQNLADAAKMSRTLAVHIADAEALRNSVQEFSTLVNAAQDVMRRSEQRSRQQYRDPMGRVLQQPEKRDQQMYTALSMMDKIRSGLETSGLFLVQYRNVIYQLKLHSDIVQRFMVSKQGDQMMRFRDWIMTYNEFANAWSRDAIARNKVFVDAQGALRKAWERYRAKHSIFLRRELTRFGSLTKKSSPKHIRPAIGTIVYRDDGTAGEVIGHGTLSWGAEVQYKDEDKPRHQNWVMLEPPRFAVGERVHVEYPPSIPVDEPAIGKVLSVGADWYDGIPLWFYDLGDPLNFEISDDPRSSIKLRKVSNILYDEGEETIVAKRRAQADTVRIDTPPGTDAWFATNGERVVVQRVGSIGENVVPIASIVWSNGVTGSYYAHDLITVMPKFKRGDRLTITQGNYTLKKGDQVEVVRVSYDRSGHTWMYLIQHGPRQRMSIDEDQAVRAFKPSDVEEGEETIVAKKKAQLAVGLGDQVSVTGGDEAGIDGAVNIIEIFNDGRVELTVEEYDEDNQPTGDEHQWIEPDDVEVIIRNRVFQTPNPKFQPGMKVRVTDGPYKGSYGTVDYMFNMLGQGNEEPYSGWRVVLEFDRTHLTDQSRSSAIPEDLLAPWDINQVTQIDTGGEETVIARKLVASENYAAWKVGDRVWHRGKGLSGVIEELDPYGRHLVPGNDRAEIKVLYDKGSSRWHDYINKFTKEKPKFQSGQHVYIDMFGDPDHRQRARILRGDHWIGYWQYLVELANGEGQPRSIPEVNIWPSLGDPTMGEEPVIARKAQLKPVSDWRVGDDIWGRHHGQHGKILDVYQSNPLYPLSWEVKVQFDSGAVVTQSFDIWVVVPPKYNKGDRVFYQTGQYSTPENMLLPGVISGRKFGEQNWIYFIDLDDPPPGWTPQQRSTDSMLRGRDEVIDPIQGDEPIVARRAQLDYKVGDTVWAKIRNNVKMIPSGAEGVIQQIREPDPDDPEARRVFFVRFKDVVVEVWDGFFTGERPPVQIGQKAFYVDSRYSGAEKRPVEVTEVLWGFSGAWEAARVEGKKSDFFHNGGDEPYMHQVSIYDLHPASMYELGDEIVVAKRKASILDEPRSTLNPSIFDLRSDPQAPKMWPDVREAVLKQLEKLNLPDDAIRSVLFFGSSAAYQYEETSDFDVTVVVDDTKTDMQGLMKEISDELFIADHPVTYYLRTDDYPIDGSDAIYDLRGDFWVRVPETAEGAIHKEEYQDTVDDAVDWAKKLDLMIGETRRDYIDYEKLSLAYNHVDESKRAEVYGRIKQKLSELQEDVAAFANESDKLHQTRAKAFAEDLDRVGEKVIHKYLNLNRSRNWLPENVLYKILERYQYTKMLKQFDKINEKRLEGGDWVGDIKQLKHSVRIARRVDAIMPDMRVVVAHHACRAVRGSQGVCKGERNGLMRVAVSGPFDTLLLRKDQCRYVESQETPVQRFEIGDTVQFEDNNHEPDYYKITNLELDKGASDSVWKYELTDKTGTFFGWVFDFPKDSRYYDGDLTLAPIQKMEGSPGTEGEIIVAKKTADRGFPIGKSVWRNRTSLLGVGGVHGTIISKELVSRRRGGDGEYVYTIEYDDGKVTKETGGRLIIDEPKFKVGDRVKHIDEPTVAAGIITEMWWMPVYIFNPNNIGWKYEVYWEDIGESSAMSEVEMVKSDMETSLSDGEEIIVASTNRSKWWNEYDNDTENSNFKLHDVVGSVTDDDEGEVISVDWNDIMSKWTYKVQWKHGPAEQIGKVWDMLGSNMWLKKPAGLVGDQLGEGDEIVVAQQQEFNVVDWLAETKTALDDFYVSIEELKNMYASDLMYLEKLEDHQAMAEAEGEGIQTDPAVVTPVAASLKTGEQVYHLTSYNAGGTIKDAEPLIVRASMMISQNEHEITVIGDAGQLQKFSRGRLITAQSEIRPRRRKRKLKIEEPEETNLEELIGTPKGQPKLTPSKPKPPSKLKLKPSRPDVPPGMIPVDAEPEQVGAEPVEQTQYQVSGEPVQVVQPQQLVRQPPPPKPAQPAPSVPTPDELEEVRFDDIPEEEWRQMSLSERIRLAAVYNHVMAMEYEKITPPETGVRKTYIVEPYSYRVKRPQRTQGTPVWYLFAFDTQDNHIKAFIVRNIRGIEILDQTFSPRWDVEFFPASSWEKFRQNRRPQQPQPEEKVTFVQTPFEA